MEWKSDNSNQDIEDRRDESGGGGGGMGLGGLGGVHLGIGGMLIVGVLSLVFHQNLFSVLSGSGSANAPSSSVNRPYAGDGATADQTQQDAQEQPEFQGIRTVFHDVQRTWDTNLAAQTGARYRHTTLVVYRDEYPSACGEAQTAVGPFYCPGDEKVYLDLGFFNELETRFGAPGKFAQAYVVAHEVGHHVQKILGIEGRVRSLQEQDPSQQNALSVRLELQADCFAGVWGHFSEGTLNVNSQDISQGLAAAAAVGDDRLQRAARGRVNPENFTHGTSAQRTNAFRTGLESGQVQSCNMLPIR